MLTTHQIVHNATSLLWPSLLVLIAWYSIAASLRALTDFAWRLFHRHRVAQKLSEVATPLIDDSPHTTPMFLPPIENRLEGLQSAVEESLLLGRQATLGRITMLFVEGTLFCILAIVAFIGAKPALNHMGSLWWMHVVGVIFFLCFILRARRLLLLIPLTFLVWSSWEMFSFITNFEKTLQASSVLASVEVLDKETQIGHTNFKVRMTFRGKNPQELSLAAAHKLFFEGRVYRVSPEVLLFGGKNIATIDRVFSDDIKPKDAVVLVKSESVPPLYRWQAYEKNFRVALREKFSYWLWKQFLELRQTRLVKTKLLEAAICSPLAPGNHFEIRLRHVGGLECHKTEKPKTAPVAPAKQTKSDLQKVSQPGSSRTVPPKTKPALRIRTPEDLRKLVPRKEPLPTSQPANPFFFPGQPR